MNLLIRYFKLYSCFFSYSLSKELQYRANFFVLVVGYIFYLIANLCLFGVIYQWTDNIGGWNFNEILIFLGTYHIIHGLWDFATALNIERISDYISQGNLDFILTKPIYSLFYVIFRNMNFPALINSFLGLVIVIYSLHSSNLQLDIFIIIAYLFLIINGVIIYTMLQLLVQCLSFFFVRTNMINRIFYQTILFSEKPGVIYSGILRKILTYIIPMLVIVNVPSELLMLRLDWIFILHNVLVTIVFLFLGNLGWNRAIKLYSSANS